MDLDKNTPNSSEEPSLNLPQETNKGQPNYTPPRVPGATNEQIEYRTARSVDNQTPTKQEFDSILGQQDFTSTPNLSKPKKSKLFIFALILIPILLLATIAVAVFAPKSSRSSRNSSSNTSFKNLSWKVPDTIASGWSIVSDEQSSHLYQHIPSSCMIFFEKRSNLTSAETNNAQTFVNNNLDSLAKALKQPNSSFQLMDDINHINFKSSDPKSSDSPQNANNNTDNLKFNTWLAKSTSTDITAKISVLVSGNNALINIIECKNQDFTTNLQEATSFAEQFFVVKTK